MSMLKTFAAAVILCGLVFPGPAAADPVPTTISASGEAVASAPPDLATVTFTISSHAANASQAMAQSNTIYAHFTTGMRAIGIATADLKTLSYNLNYTPPPPPCPPAQIGCVRDPNSYGFFVTRSVAVTTHHMDEVGKVIDTAVAAGVNNVNGVSFGVANSRALFLQALGKAVASARAEADVMAQAAGLRITRVQNISASYAPPIPLRTIANVVSAGVYAPPTQISPPAALDVQASVSITYEAAP